MEDGIVQNASKILEKPLVKSLWLRVYKYHFLFFSMKQTWPKDHQTVSTRQNDLHITGHVW